MTHRQRDLLRFIERYQAAHDGASPSFAEMEAGLGLHSKSGVHRMLIELEAQGLISRRKNRTRCIALTGAREIDLSGVSTGRLAAELVRRGFTPGLSLS